MGSLSFVRDKPDVRIAPFNDGHRRAPAARAYSRVARADGSGERIGS
jgi:hypothetical protein